MQKRWVIIAGAAIIIAGIGGVLVASKRSGNVSELLVQETRTSPSPTAAPKFLTWDDPAGFSFRYPEGLTVNSHQEDNDTYAHVELTSKEHAGNLIVWAKDTNSADITAWVRTEPSFAGSPVLDTSLGGKPAKKVSLTGPDRLETGTIDDSLLFLVYSTLTDKQYWTGVHATVSDSFTFKPATGSDSASGTQGGDADEEETVQ